MNKEFDKNEQNLIEKLKSLGEGIVPSKESFKRLLSSLPDEGVTKYDTPRYTFSMWRYVFAAVVVVIVGGFAFFKHGQVNPANQTAQVAQNQGVPTQSVTADNADATLQQTDQAIQSATDQMDQDLKALDQTSSGNDLNNI